MSAAALFRGTGALTLCIAAGSIATAQANEKGSVSFAVPESPVFSFLGASPAKVSQPGTARDLAIQLANTFDVDGKVRQGVAVDLRPARLWGISLASYREDFWKRLLYNAQFSFGTTQTPGQEGATDLAVGVRLTVVDGADPMLDGAYVDKLRDTVNQCKPDQPGGATNKDLACIDALTKRHREDWLERQWNAARLSIAFVHGWRAPGSVLKDTDAIGWGLWAAGSYPVIGSHGQLIGQLTYAKRPESALAEDAAPERFSYGLRALFGSGRVNAFAEMTGTSLFGLPEGVDTDDRENTWAAGVEVRVADTLWVSTGLGAGFGNGKAPSSVAILANVRFGLSDESAISR